MSLLFKIENYILNKMRCDQYDFPGNGEEGKEQNEERCIVISELDRY